MKSLLTVVVVTLLVATIVFPITRPSAAAASDRATADTLKQLEGEFMEAAAERGSAGYMSYYADDAVEVPNGEAILDGKANIANTMGFLDSKDNHLTWAPVGADISASGDLGYTYGNYEFRSKDKDGKPTVSHGKYTASGRNRKTATGRLSWTWGMPARSRNKSFSSRPLRPFFAHFAVKRFKTKP